jgi:FdhD protein
VWVESLTEAMRVPSKVRDGRSVTPGQVMRALEALSPLQVAKPQRFTRPHSSIRIVGRWPAQRAHKLGGALARSGTPGHTGMVLLTSRVSIEMVQKAAVIGAPVMVAMSAPTAIAVRAAEVARITLIAIARRDGFEIFFRRLTSPPTLNIRS